MGQLHDHLPPRLIPDPDPCGERTLDALAAKTTAAHADMLQLAEHMLAALDGLARGYALLLTRMDRQEAQMRAVTEAARPAAPRC
jgi:hypothetical protein